MSYFAIETTSDFTVDELFMELVLRLRVDMSDQLDNAYWYWFMPSEKWMRQNCKTFTDRWMYWSIMDHEWIPFDPLAPISNILIVRENRIHE